MGCLIGRHRLEVFVEGCVVASLCELRFCETRQTLAVEVVLEMLEGQSKVEDIT